MALTRKPLGHSAPVPSSIFSALNSGQSPDRQLNKDYYFIKWASTLLSVYKPQFGERSAEMSQMNDVGIYISRS